MRRNRGVGRALKYAWIEMGSPEDGKALCSELDALGWENLSLYLPRVTDAGTRYLDYDRPYLPIRRRGNAVFILPNAFRDSDAALLQEPLFRMCRRYAGTDMLEKELKTQTEFLSEWIFSPGLQVRSKTEAALTLDPDQATHSANLVVVSGHGSGGDVWGGDIEFGLSLTEPLKWQDPIPGHRSLHPDYILIPACMNVTRQLAEDWAPALRREHPVRGIFGYAAGYPGAEAGAAIMRRFVQHLKKNGGEAPLLEAWAAAHEGPFEERWAALIHQGARGDTLKAWRTGTLAPLGRDGEIRWLDHRRYPDGMLLDQTAVHYYVLFGMGRAEKWQAIFDLNNRTSDYGLFPGEEGELRVRAESPGRLDPGALFSVRFYFWRPQKDGMDLERLLEFDRDWIAAQGIRMELQRDLNPEDGTHHVDGFTFTVDGPPPEGIVRFPYRVRPDAPEYYGTLERPGPNAFGRFWIEIIPPEPFHRNDNYRAFAMLRGRR